MAHDSGLRSERIRNPRGGGHFQDVGGGFASDDLFKKLLSLASEHVILKLFFTIISN